MENVLNIISNNTLDKEIKERFSQIKSLLYHKQLPSLTSTCEAVINQEYYFND